MGAFLQAPIFISFFFAVSLPSHCSQEAQWYHRVSLVPYYVHSLRCLCFGDVAEPGVIAQNSGGSWFLEFFLRLNSFEEFGPGLTWILCNCRVETWQGSYLHSRKVELCGSLTLPLPTASSSSLSWVSLLLFWLLRFVLSLSLCLSEGDIYYSHKILDVIDTIV
jgi:hypothetical protein